LGNEPTASACGDKSREETIEPNVAQDGLKYLGVTRISNAG